VRPGASCDAAEFGREKRVNRCSCILLLGALALTAPAEAQRIQTPNAAEIQLGLEKLNVLGSVLYVAAHPDDENTAALAYFSKGEKLRTGYLSLTRGDGGQNLIGSERGAEIGIIRTQELLAARGEEAVLADVVWIIRSFRPDVIVTRFPVDRSSGHGHHTSSARLAREAFHAAGDPQRFPEQLDRVEPWQAKRLFWNGWRLSEQEQAEAVRVDVGEFDPLLGSSYSEIAAISRSMHKSQGFGAAGRRGTRYEYFKLVEGSLSGKELLSGIDTSWSRVPGGHPLGVKLGEITEGFDPRDPARSLPQLLEAYSEMRKLEPTSWIEVKQRELLGLIQACAGLWLEAISTDFAAAPGDSVTVKTTLINRSNLPFRLKSISFGDLESSSLQDVVLEDNTPHTIESSVQIPPGYPTSQPYWLRNSPKQALFSVSDQSLIGAAENVPSLQGNGGSRGRGQGICRHQATGNSSQGEDELAGGRWHDAAVGRFGLARGPREHSLCPVPKV